MQNVAIITGISGQDGAYLSKFLLDKGYKVIGLTRKITSSSLDKLTYLGVQNQVSLFECDLMNEASLIDILSKFEPTEIYNLSAQSSVGQSFEQPGLTIQYNIQSFLSILESVRKLNLYTKIYQASSSEMFGHVSNLPVTLGTPIRPISPYGSSKASAYWLGIAYRESYRLYVSNCILFNHESYLRGNNFFFKKVIRESILISKGLKDKLIVGNIDVKRDFGYTPKYVEAMWLSLQQYESDDYIICSGESIYLRQIIEYVFERLSIHLNHLLIDKSLFRNSEVLNIYGDNTTSKEKLGWNYDISYKDLVDLILEEELRMFDVNF